jgi:polysaccharide pyruvyl transferase WcaK-like protein
MSHLRPVPRFARLRGNFDEGNFGDDALLLACTSLLRGKVKLAQVETNVAYYDDRMHDFFAPSNQLIAPDIIIYGGGTQFFSFSTSEPTAMRSVLSRVTKKILSPTSLITSYRARSDSARNKLIPKVAIGLGVGPFDNAVAAQQAAGLLRQMELVWVRDAHSEHFCRSYDVPNVISSSDLCFTEAFAQITTPRSGRERSGAEPLKIGIILRDWKDLCASFFRRQAALASKLRTSGHEVTFLSLSKHDDFYLGEMATLGETVRVWDAKSELLEDFWALIAAQDLMVTSRFHGAIFSLLSSTPFIAIEIEPKLSNLREMVPELGDFAVDPSTDVDTMHHAVEALLARREGILPALDRALMEQRLRARAGEDALKSYFEDEAQK